VDAVRFTCSIPSAWPHFSATSLPRLLCSIVGLSLISSGCKDRVDEPALKPSPKTAEARAIQAHDTNGDGELSESEKQQMEQKFVDSFDRNEDATLDQTERQAVRKKAEIAVRPGAPKLETIKDAASFLTRMDSNGDKEVSAAEAGVKRWQVLRQADENEDGRVTAQEWLDHRGDPVR